MGIASLFEVRSGININNANILSGNGIPGGSGGFPDEAGRGSLYLDITNGLFYLKKQTGTGSDKWVRLQGKDDMDAALLGLSWRDPARLYDGSAYDDLADAETAVNTNTIDGVTVVDGDRILFDNISGSNKNVFVITGTPGSGAILVEDGNSTTKGDALYIQEGTAAGKQYSFNGTLWVQQGAASATEIAFIQAFIGKGGNGNEQPNYPSNNVVTDGDSLEKAIGDLDGEIGAAVSGAVARTVGTISDQSVNRNIEALDDAIGSDVTSTHIVSTAGSVNANLSLVDEHLAKARTEINAAEVTDAITLDSVFVDEIVGIEWMLHIRNHATPSSTRFSRVVATHNGAGTADATTAGWSEYGVVKTGSIAPPVNIDVDVSGSGAAQVMRLRVSCSDAVDINAIRTVVTKV